MKKVVRVVALTLALGVAFFSSAWATPSLNCFIWCSNGGSGSFYQTSPAACCALFETACGGNGGATYVFPPDGGSQSAAFCGGGVSD